jgi:hypothetical protein
MAEDEDSDPEGEGKIHYQPDTLDYWVDPNFPWYRQRLSSVIHERNMLAFRVAAARLAHRAKVEFEIARDWLWTKCQQRGFLMFWVAPGHRLPTVTDRYTFPISEGPEAVARSGALVLRDDIDVAVPYLREDIQGPIAIESPPVPPRMTRGRDFRENDIPRAKKLIKQYVADGQKSISASARSLFPDELLVGNEEFGTGPPDSIRRRIIARARKLRGNANDF